MTMPNWFAHDSNADDAARMVRSYLSQANPSTSDVRPAADALQAMRNVQSPSSLQNIWKQLGTHEQQQLEEELLAERGQWKPTNEDIHGRLTGDSSDKAITLTEAQHLQTDHSAAEDLINAHLKGDLTKFTADNSHDTGSKASSTLYLEHIHHMMVNRDQDEMTRDGANKHPHMELQNGPMAINFK